MSAKTVSSMLSVILGLVSIGPAAASDAQFSRALNAVGCHPDRIAVMRKEQGMQIYQVRCVGNPPWSVGVFCGKNACSVSSGRGDGGSAIGASG